ncbi:MAG: DUF4919 domain-containing protein [Bacteroidales bacterium]
MKRLFFITILAMFTGFLEAQTTPVDLKKVKAFAVTEEYDQLLKRFCSNDTTLRPDDYRMLYYGQAFRMDFHPYASPDSARALRDYINTHGDTTDYRVVLRYTQMILDKFPFSLDEIYLTATAYDWLGERGLSEIWFFKFNSLVRTILSSGDGKKEKTAFIVTGVPDEYVILGVLGFQIESQALTGKRGKRYDVLSLSENEYHLSKMYFDINLFFGKGF